MPYVEGFGTWPFGEEWLWEAVACVYLPLLELLDGAPRHASGSRRCCATSSRPCAATRATATCASCARSAPPIHAEDAAGLERGGEPELAAEVRRAAGDYARRRAGASSAAAATCSAPSARSTGSSSGPPRPPTPLLPLLATDAGLRLQLAHRDRLAPAPLRRLGRRLLAARVRLRARPRARPGRRTACAPSASTRRRSTASARPRSSSRWRPRPGRSRCRSTGRRSSWSGTTATATRRTAPTATTTAARSTTSSPWDNAGRPYDREAALALAARARARLRRPGAPTRLRAAAGCSAARSTPSCSATGGTRARPGSRRCSRRPPRQGLELVTVSRGARARASRCDAAAGRLHLGQRQGPVHLGRAGGRRPRLRRPPRRAAHRRRGRGARRAARGARARRPRAAGPAGERLGVHGHPRAGGRLPAARASRRTRAATTPRWRLWQTPRPCRSPQLRNLAPGPRPRRAHHALTARAP